MAPAFFLQVSPTSGVPIYRQLLDQIRAQVASGRLPPDQFLPSVRQLAQQLQVNPMTVSKAYSLLERDGLVELGRGQGMRVRRATPPRAGACGPPRRPRRPTGRPASRSSSRSSNRSPPPPHNFPSNP